MLFCSERVFFLPNPNQVLLGKTWQNCDPTTMWNTCRWNTTIALLFLERWRSEGEKCHLETCRHSNPSSRLGMRMCCLSQYLFDFCDKTMFRIFPGFTMALLYKHTCGALTPAADRGDSSLLLPNISGRFATAARWECAIKQPTLECFICVLRLPRWGFVFGLPSFFFSPPQTHSVKTNISPNTNTEYLKPNQSWETQTPAYCTFSWYVMTGWSSVHCHTAAAKSAPKCKL